LFFREETRREKINDNLGNIILNETKNSETRFREQMHHYLQ